MASCSHWVCKSAATTADRLFLASLPKSVEARTKVNAHYTFTLLVSVLRLKSCSLIFLDWLTSLLHAFPNVNPVSLRVCFPVGSGGTGRRSFEIMDPEIRWIESLSAMVFPQQSSEKEYGPYDFRTWQEVREHFSIWRILQTYLRRRMLFRV